jgi:hypothetical protein
LFRQLHGSSDDHPTARQIIQLRNNLQKFKNGGKVREAQESSYFAEFILAHFFDCQPQNTQWAQFSPFKCFGK